MLTNPASVGPGKRCAGPHPGWEWIPDAAPWLKALAGRSSDWTTAPLVLSNEAVFQSALAKAIESGCSWLLHPCLSPLLRPEMARPDAQARMAFWIAIQSDFPLRSFGSIQLDCDVNLFGPGGGFPVAAGLHRFADLAAFMPEGPRDPIPDPWGNALPERAAIGDLAETAWWKRSPLSEAEQEQCRDDILALLKAQRALRSILPDAYRWFAGMTRVVVPLGRGGSSKFRSGSVGGIPGLIMVEITGSYLLTLEALVHETAHLYFHFCETANPFIQTDHARLYTSPLRVDPRPLRGIFLAYHALIYMCAFYSDWFAATGDVRCLEALDDLRPRREDAGGTMASAKAELTDSGRAFLRKCDELVDHEAPAGSTSRE